MKLHWLVNLIKEFPNLEKLKQETNWLQDVVKVKNLVNSNSVVSYKPNRKILLCLHPTNFYKETSIEISQLRCLKTE